MDMIVPGLFLGSLNDSKDKEQIKKNSITHVVTIIEYPKAYHKVNFYYSFRLA
jgi:hypothetical protein